MPIAQNPISSSKDCKDTEKASQLPPRRGVGGGGSNNAVTVTMGEIYLDEQEIFSESSEDKVAHVNQVVGQGDNLSLDASLYYSDEGPPKTPHLPRL